jgi:hypothetical protein
MLHNPEFNRSENSAPLLRLMGDEKIAGEWSSITGYFVAGT